MDKENLKIILSSISKGNCVLFLGPKFAVNKEGSKIHDLLRAHLSVKYDLDQEFNNLFILRTPSPNAMTVSKMRIRFKEFYDEVVPNEVYNQISAIGFKAIVSCSHDLFLRNAFINRWKEPPDFRYFSSKGPQEISIPEQTNNTLPLYFNVFGSLSDENSLIITYDSFYEFLLRLISDNPKIPQGLQTALSKSSVLIFLGFDLSKWYMPLLFRKLSEYIGLRDTTNNYVAFASIEDTNDVPAAMIDTEYWLNHFAVEINGLDVDSLTLINELSTEKDAQLKFTKSKINFEKKRLAEITPEEQVLICSSLKKVNDLITDTYVDEAIDLLKTTFRQIEDEYNIAINFQSRLSAIDVEYHKTNDMNEKKAQMSLLRNDIVQYCLSKMREINCTEL